MPDATLGLPDARWLPAALDLQQQLVVGRVADRSLAEQYFDTGTLELFRGPTRAAPVLPSLASGKQEGQA